MARRPSRAERRAADPEVQARAAQHKIDAEHQAERAAADVARAAADVARAARAADAAYMFSVASKAAALIYASSYHRD